MKKNIIKKIKYILWGLRIYYLFDLEDKHFFYQALKVKILNIFGFPQLGRMFLSPSHQCNINCPHCYEKFQFKDETKNLTTDECKQIIDEFKKIGGYLVYFCSGEFLMRSDALDLIKYCHERKIATSLTTNGIIIDEIKIKELKEAGLNILVVSIDSADPKKHDSLRGAGVLAKATKALELAKQNGIRTQIWTYMTRSHQDELDGIARLGREVGVDYVHVFFTTLSGNLLNKFEENLTIEDKIKIREKYIGEYPIILEFSGESWRCKGGGNDHLNIMPTGDTTFCPAIPYSYGNIKKESLKNILIRMRKDYKKLDHCVRGQCPVNYIEYREKCNAKFIYSKN